MKAEIRLVRGTGTEALWAEVYAIQALFSRDWDSQAVAVESRATADQISTLESQEFTRPKADTTAPCPAKPEQTQQLRGQDYVGVEVRTRA